MNDELKFAGVIAVDEQVLRAAIRNIITLLNNPDSSSAQKLARISAECLEMYLPGVLDEILKD